MTDVDLDKLDRLAAEKVLGWRRDQDGLYHLDEKITLYCDGSTEPGASVWWQPTRNIAQAWECITKLFPTSFKLEVDYDYGIDARAGWNVTIDKICYETWSDTAPLAIVLAALKAKEVDLDA